MWFPNSASGDKVVYFAPQYDENGLPDFESVKAVFAKVEALIAEGSAKAVWSISGGGIAEGVTKMCLGNRLGFKFDKPMTDEELFTPVRGAFLVEVDRALQTDGETIGAVNDKYEIVCGDLSLSMNELQKLWEDKLEPVYPCNIKTRGDRPNTYVNVCKEHRSAAIGIAKPRVLIPVFPGTNCEYDTAKAFENAGARAEIFVIRNLTPHDIEESAAEMARRIGNSQIVMIPGGFSGGDEPDGSGKFITSFFRNPAIRDSVHTLLGKRDGLMLGICNGFQALIKLGLVPYGEIRDAEENSPTLTFNTIDRHQSMMVRTRVASNMSPWLAQCEVGDIHTVAISHGEGRFVADQALIKRPAENGQIATQYVDTLGHPTFDIRFNPNTSFDAIEGITSPDGRVFGKMAHPNASATTFAKTSAARRIRRSSAPALLTTK
ncbi:MAG: phosphoribosylformylglycinamidine synthase subunit PurQ [Oscillospiraceae bacterium]